MTDEVKYHGYLNQEEDLQDKYFYVVNPEKAIDPLAEWIKDSKRLAENIKKAEQQILNKHVDRVNNILYLLLVLLYAIGVGIVLKYLV